MRTWITARAAEASTHAGSVLAVAATFITAHPDDVAAVYTDITGGHVSTGAIRIVSTLLAALGGVLIGTPNKAAP